MAGFIDFIIRNGATILVTAVLLILIGLVVAYLLRRKKRGQCVGCDCACGSCPAAAACAKEARDREKEETSQQE